MRMLVTGGAGFIGSNFVELLVNQYPDEEIAVLDKLTYAGNINYLKNIREKIEFIHGDICNPNDILKAGKCDIIFNFAAETHVDRSIENSNNFVITDILGTNTLLDYALKNDIDRFVQISTDEVYGSINAGSFIETDTFNPSSPYSASKAGAEMLVSAYNKTYSLPTIITRSSNNYGPHQYPEKLIPVLILKALKNEPLPIYGNGKNIRDWIYVEDNCRGILTAFEKGKEGEAYNIGGGCEKRNIDIAKIILKSLNKPENLIQFVKDRPGHDFRYSVNCDKIKDLNWNTKYTFEEGIQKTIDWYLRNKYIWL
ncbi:dTDP-glucose 4,6-dehydratase [Methanoplanus limicola]|uniref:dTDP-glucose 4,6-dehydratase n=1 Tax=Methanoplanus limicola DSM 2279 TaxID=937775 RepID=H1YXC4_9EURY|nr:dTDP-glucose 4,6-dehydratase [Methanoplanus limicola]EHQ36861.1 dTDP-glucose 4,6-dehydratase [Methanoplanus limicola DSM 2279]